MKNEEVIAAFRDQAIDHLSKFIDETHQDLRANPDGYEGITVEDVWTWYTESFY